MPSQAMTHIKSWAAATVRFLLRPFTIMWPMVVTMIVYYALERLLLHGNVIVLKGALPELYVMALLLSLLRGKWRTVITAIAMVAVTLLTSIEVFINTRFGLTLASEIFQLMLESSAGETSQFMSQFVMQWSTLPHIAVPLICAAEALMLRRYSHREHVKQRLNLSVAKQSVMLAGVIAYFLYTGWVTEQPGYFYVMASDNVSDFEKRYIHARENGGCGANTSITRLGFGAKLYSLTSQQCDEVLATAQNTQVAACSHTSPQIMLLIGESGIKRHYQIYGYDHNTTPCMQAEKDNGCLTVMEDVMTPYIQTSEVLKEMLSTHSVEQPGTWTSAPMLPQIMKMSGYRVSYVTNQYPKLSDNVWNSTGGFFMRDERVGKILLDYITLQGHERDDSLLIELDQVVPTKSKYNFIMMHVHGQHVAFELSYPADRQHFTVKDYANRRTLNDEQKQQVAHYDNSTLYQDSICGALFDRYRDKDMIIIYASDHGENVYDDGKTLGRVHNDFSPAMVDSQYRIPMWIWCSPRYCELHPEMIARIKAAARLPFQTDDMPHLIMDLAGVQSKHFAPSRSPLNAHFNVKRPRRAEQMTAH